MASSVIWRILLEGRGSWFVLRVCNLLSIVLVNFWTSEHGRGPSGDPLTWRATDMIPELPSTSAAKQRRKSHPGGWEVPTLPETSPGTLLFHPRASGGALFLPELLLHQALLALPPSRPASSPVTSQHPLPSSGSACCLIDVILMILRLLYACLACSLICFLPLSSVYPNLFSLQDSES